MINKKIKFRQDLFNLIFSIIFLVILFCGIKIIKEREVAIGILEIFIVVFGISRLTRLVVFDSIGQFFRDLFLKIEIKEDGEIIRKKHDWGFRKSISDILGCPWCTSIWLSLFTIPLYALFPLEVFIVSLILAISGVATFFLFSTHLIREKIDLVQEKIKNEKSK